MPTILVIDDDVVLLARLSARLEEAGYSVLRAGEVRHAELLIAEEQLDLILLDTGINRGAGWSLLERIAPRLPVIVIGGQGLEEDVIRGLDAGAADYVPKPFRTGELLARVRARLRAGSGARSEGPGVERQAVEPADQVSPDDEPTAAIARQSSRADNPPARGRRRADEQDEPVFIPYGEEQHLLREPARAPAGELQIEDIAQLPLGRRLYAARQRKRISLVQAELESKVRMHYIQAMEEEKFSLLPRGPVAEELLHAYAAYLGLDAGQALDEYRHLHYSAPVEPLPALGGAPLPRMLPRWTIWFAAVALALVVGLGGIWLVDPRGMTALADRARTLIAPPTATPTPVATPTPTPVPTPPTPTP